MLSKYIFVSVESVEFCDVYFANKFQEQKRYEMWFTIHFSSNIFKFVMFI